MSFSELKQNLQFLTIQNYALCQMGIDLNAAKGVDLFKSFWKFLLLISITLYLEYCLLNFALHADIDMVTGPLSMFNQGILILFKMAFFLCKRESFMKLLWTMNNLAKDANRKEYQVWLSENRRSQLIGKLYFYSCWAAAGSAGTLPLIFMAYEYYKGIEIKQKLPFGGKFPYDNGGSLYFIFNYILSMIYVFALLNMTVAIDTLYGWYIYNVSAHFRILRIKIENTALKLKNGDSRTFTKDVASIVRYHNTALEFVDDLNGIFVFILWAEVMLSCLQMCFIIYSLNNDADIANRLFYGFVFVAITIQLIIYCFGGDKIQTENDMLCMDIYLRFPWHKMSVKEKKLLFLSLMRSQKPFTLTGIFFEVNRSLLVYIFKTAFSFNALLSAMNE